MGVIQPPLFCKGSLPQATALRKVSCMAGASALAAYLNRALGSWLTNIGIVSISKGVGIWPQSFVGLDLSQSFSTSVSVGRESNVVQERLKIWDAANIHSSLGYLHPMVAVIAPRTNCQPNPCDRPFKNDRSFVSRHSLGCACADTKTALDSSLAIRKANAQGHDQPKEKSLRLSSSEFPFRIVSEFSFTIKIIQMWVNIPHRNDMGYKWGYVLTPIFMGENNWVTGGLISPPKKSWSYGSRAYLESLAATKTMLNGPTKMYLLGQKPEPPPANMAIAGHVHDNVFPSSNIHTLTSTIVKNGKVSSVRIRIIA